MSYHEAPHVLTEEEIEFYMKGDRREIDRLMLRSINRLTAILLPHMMNEDERDEQQKQFIEDLGGSTAMKSRAEFVDALIKRQEARTQMMQKVATSSVIWALIAFMGFIAVSSWKHVVSVIQAGG